MSQRPFEQTRTQQKWDEECVESAVFTLIAGPHPSQADKKTLTWQRVHTIAKEFDGYTGTGELVQRLLAENSLDTIKSSEVAEGYVAQRDI